MNRNRILLPLAAALLATLAVAGCKKKEPVETPTTSLPPAAATLSTPAPAPAPMPTAASATVMAVDLGNAAGADMKITSPTNSFGTKDKIIAAVATHVSDPAATVPAKIAAKWSHVDSSQTVREDARDVQLKGDQVWDFEITNSDPWPTGKYRVEVMLDGAVVQSRDFEVK
ncbi:hypothetical protein [Noviluteimonas gilva]|uniref:Uncharacterized protein n=1 Tax=Noviluteimonas gilva TaxID=2682097 RepID=A0A7C9LL34_9GAMM|nr:hypothetical protein [Lysobacter gilvus]MUV13163.1 hypothetical protein [Lysobacter gilvus]